MTRDTGWYKSSYTSSGNDSCVEVRFVTSDSIGIRDSKSPATGTLWVPPARWNAFLEFATASR